MAIVKWKFGQAPSQTTQPEPPKQAPVQIVTADGKQFGLENFGNTCYANSVLQALYFCSPLRDLVIQSPDSAAGHEDPASFLPSPTVLGQQVRHKPDRKPSATHTPSRPADPTASQLTASSSGSTSATLFSALRALFLHIAQNPQDKGTVAPRAFIEKLRELNELFRSTMHQDAHEFLNYVLNKIVDELEEERKRNADGKGASHDDLSNSVATLATTRAPSTSYSLPSASTLVHRLFEGTLTSETRCLTCETVSSRDESFLDLSVDIEQNSSITACLRQFSASEMLCQRNKFFCDSCCDLQEAEKRMKIKRLPNVLALHLKRFKYQEDVGRYIKLAYRVAFPLELRLFNTVDDAQDPDRLYKLFAIVVHIGNGPHHGHYITIVKAANPNAPGQWLVFDDDNVDTIKESDIPKYYGDSNSGSAYVLFYQAVDIDLRSLGLRVPDEPSDSSLAASATQSAVANGSTAHQEEHINDPRSPPGLSDSNGMAATYPFPQANSPALSQTEPVPSHSPPPLEVAIPPPEMGKILSTSGSTPTRSKGIPIPSARTLGRKKTDIGKDGPLARSEGTITSDMTGQSPSTTITKSAAHDPVARSPPNGFDPSDAEFGKVSASVEKEGENHKEKKGGFLPWRRRSVRQSKTFTPLLPPSPTIGPSSSVGHGSADTRFNTTGHAQPSRPSSMIRQASEQGPKSPLAMARHRSEQGSKRPTTASSVGSTGTHYGTSLPPPMISMSSSPSSSGSLPVPSSGPPPLQPKSPLRANRDHTTSPPSSFAYPSGVTAPDHKKSMPQLTASLSHRRDPGQNHTLPRPMSIAHIPTNGAVSSAANDLPPVPPLPSFATSVPNSPTLGVPHAHFATSSGKGKEPENGSTEALTTRSGSSSPMHSTAPNSATAALNPNGHSGNLAFKRATRKLSFSGGMLGFGRKKDKDKERAAKDVSDTIPNNSFQTAAFSMGSRL